MKKLLLEAPILRKADYTEGKPIYVTVDTSPTGIGWVVNEEEEGNVRYAVQFGAKVLSEREQRYAQVKRELWGIVSAVKTDKDYLIGSEVIIETDCATPDLAMLRWIAYIKSLNPEIHHIGGKENAMADMLARARFKNESDMVRKMKTSPSISSRRLGYQRKTMTRKPSTPSTRMSTKESGY